MPRMSGRTRLIIAVIVLLALVVFAHIAAKNHMGFIGRLHGGGQRP